VWGEEEGGKTRGRGGRGGILLRGEGETAQGKKEWSRGYIGGGRGEGIDFLHCIRGRGSGSTGNDSDSIDGKHEKKEDEDGDAE
jgi:hypothetical protein